MVNSLREIIFFPNIGWIEVDLFDCNKTAPVLFTGYQAAQVSSSWVRNEPWSNGRNIPSQHIVQHCWHLLRQCCVLYTKTVVTRHVHTIDVILRIAKLLVLLG